MATIHADTRAALEWAFANCLDDDSSGFIEQREVNFVAKALGYGRGETGESIATCWEKMLKDMDTNKDGKISMEEFVVFMAKEYCSTPSLAAQLKEELSNSKNKHRALQHAVAAEMFLDDMEEVDISGAPAAAAATSAAATSAAPPTPVLSADKRQKLQEKFAELDQDGSKTLSKSEVADVLLLDEGDEALEALWKKADVDGDGAVSFEEFTRAAEEFDKAMAAALGDTPDLPGL